MRSQFTNKLTYYFLHYSEMNSIRMQKQSLGDELSNLRSDFQKSLFDE
jgi:hypothetical protein